MSQNPQSSSSGGMIKKVAVLLVLVLIAFGAYRMFSNRASAPSTPASAQVRSKAPGVVTSLATATALDAKGAPVAAASTFKTTDKAIYLVASLNAPKVGTKIEYIRYLNGKYLDSGSLKTTKASVSYASFAWKLKNATSRRLLGTYRVKVYTGGVFEKEISYTIQQ